MLRSLRMSSPTHPAPPAGQTPEQYARNRIVHFIVSGHSTRKIVRRLVSEGWSEPDAREKVQQVRVELRPMKVQTEKSARAEALRTAIALICTGVVLLVLGGLLTAATFYWNLGFRAFAYGPIVFGALSIIGGLGRLAWGLFRSLIASARR